MGSDKKLAIYERQDPFRDGVEVVAIQTETTPHYVMGVYFDPDDPDLAGLRRASDVAVLEIDRAQNEYEFRKGSLKHDVKWN